MRNNNQPEDMADFIRKTVEESLPDIFHDDMDPNLDVIDLMEEPDTLVTDDNVFGKRYDPVTRSTYQVEKYGVTQVHTVVIDNPDEKVTIYNFKSAMSYRGYKKADEIIPHTPPSGNNLQLLTHLESCYKDGFVNKDEAAVILLQYIAYYGSTYHHEKVKEIGALLFEGGSYV